MVVSFAAAVADIEFNLCVSIEAKEESLVCTASPVFVTKDNGVV